MSKPLVSVLAGVKSGGLKLGRLMSLTFLTMGLYFVFAIPFIGLITVNSCSYSSSSGIVLPQGE